MVHENGLLTDMPKQTGFDARKIGGLVDCDGNPGRVSIPSRDASLPPKATGSARGSLARTNIHLVRLVNCTG
jgi:hypothetical protein